MEKRTLENIRKAYLTKRKKHAGDKRRASGAVKRAEGILKKAVERQTEVYKKYPSWVDWLVRPIAEAVAPNFPGRTYDILGPFGLSTVLWTRFPPTNRSKSARSSPVTSRR